MVLFRSVRPIFITALIILSFVLPVSAQGAMSLVSNGSPADTTPQNHQNEPAVAIDANHPNFAVSGWNDFVDWRPCPQDSATQFGTCADPADSGVGLSGVAFSFDSGHSWVQPTYTGWTAADCSPTGDCTPHVGPIHTLPCCSGWSHTRQRGILMEQRFACLLCQPRRGMAFRLCLPEPGVPWLSRGRCVATR